MFPSAGYFRSAFCPFFIHGLCHRPYCHFKHARPVKEETPVPTGNSCLTTVVSNTSVLDNPSIELKVNDKNQSDKHDIDKRKNIDKEVNDDKNEHESDTKANKSKPNTTQKLSLTDITDLLRVPGCKIDEDTEELAVDAEEIGDKKDLNIYNNIDNDIHSNIKVRDLHSKPQKSHKKLTNLDFFSLDIPKSNIKKQSGDKTNNANKTKHGIKRKANEVNIKNDKSLEKKDKSLEKKDNGSILSSEVRKTKGDHHSKVGQKEKNDLSSSGDDETPKSMKSKFHASKKLNLDSDLRKPGLNLKKTMAGISDYIPENCVDTVGHASVKKRIAHSEDNELGQKAVTAGRKTKIFPSKPSYVSPLISGKEDETLNCTAGQSSPNVPSVNKSNDQAPAYATEKGTYLGKKRTAHPMNFYKKENQSTLKRPKIPVEFGSKVPQNVRQRYLDKLIDEYLPKCTGEEEAFSVALEEESVIFQRSTRRQIYMNLCVNAIKRIRELPNPEETPSVSVQATSPLVTAQTTAQTISGLSRSTVAKGSKVCIRPSAASLALTQKKHSSLLQAKVVPPSVRKQSQESVSLTEDIFYEHLLGYLASEDALVENNYPRSVPGKPGTASIKSKAKEPSETETKRICIRCGKQFFMTEDGDYVTKEECHYHWGKIRRVRGQGEIVMNFSCCQGEAGSLGCCACKLHVSDFSRTPFGYVTTADSSVSANQKQVFSLDCEMCYTSRGLELTRVSVVNFDLEEVFDTFVKPDRDIIDYNTRFSGVTEKDLRHVKIKLKDVQNFLLTLFGTNTILMGHSLESDLKALKIIHDRVVDTALVFPHKMGLPYKRALRNLMAEHLQKIIQDSEGGHDSSEDSSACMELMRWRVTEDIKKKARMKHYKS